MNIKPLLDNVLLEPVETKTTNSGILLPDSVNEKPMIAVVVAVGTSEEILVKINDVVLFDKFQGQEFTLDGKHYVMIKQKDIMAIID